MPFYLCAADQTIPVHASFVSGYSAWWGTQSLGAVERRKLEEIYQASQGGER